jgi:HAMP domain-containing protein
MQTKMTVLALALFLPAAAQSALASEEPGRYSITPAGDGFMRLDSATGAVSICSSKPGGWTCESVADDVLALKQEVDRLTRENEALRDKLAEAEVGPKSPGAGTAPLPGSPSIEIPGSAIDEINDFVAKMMRRLQDLVRDLENQSSQREL